MTSLIVSFVYRGECSHFYVVYVVSELHAVIYVGTFCTLSVAEIFRQRFHCSTSCICWCADTFYYIIPMENLHLEFLSNRNYENILIFTIDFLQNTETNHFTGYLLVSLFDWNISYFYVCVVTYLCMEIVSVLKWDNTVNINVGLSRRGSFTLSSAVRWDLTEAEV
jgi:hypothetical protein